MEEALAPISDESVFMTPMNASLQRRGISRLATKLKFLLTLSGIEDMR